MKNESLVCLAKVDKHLKLGNLDRAAMYMGSLISGKEQKEILPEKKEYIKSRLKGFRFRLDGRVQKPDGRWYDGKAVWEEDIPKITQSYQSIVGRVKLKSMEIKYCGEPTLVD